MDYVRIIKKIPRIHCARGPKICDKCKQASKEKSYSLIKVYIEPSNIARPITEVYVGCRKIVGEFEVQKRFKTLEEAKKYAIEHGIEIDFSIE
ncbi:MAG: hypothetical protein GF317_20450 [Candidatus Lokiarchaeota archaeon]|nr:hypothetical protein [Candidatus Lokiarchaeota archaeon]MBD3201857.1 hypothetical protein [Candidatus Lokiarchaeota archaeon]